MENYIKEDIEFLRKLNFTFPEQEYFEESKLENECPSRLSKIKEKISNSLEKVSKNHDFIEEYLKGGFIFFYIKEYFLLEIMEDCFKIFPNNNNNQLKNLKNIAPNNLIEILRESLLKKRNSQIDEFMNQLQNSF